MLRRETAFHSNRLQKDVFSTAYEAEAKRFRQLTASAFQNPPIFYAFN
ncbi:hypothetical protein EFW58_00416 [Bacillus velezensis]|nr:hypothetical protein EFW58_00416 [Bacillus velezensis]